MARRRRLLLFVAALLAAGAGLLADGLGALEDLTIDARFAVRSDDTVPARVAVLGMDGESFAVLGDDPPFDRRRHAEAIAALKAAGARTIVYDIEFARASRPAADLALFRALRRAGNVVVAVTEYLPDREPVLIGGPDSRARAGYPGFAVAKGDVIRRVQARVDGFPTLAAVASGVSRGAIIDYRGDVETIPFHRAVEGELPSLEDRVVVVGNTDITGQDQQATPVGTRYGAEVHAAAIDTLLRGSPLRETGGWLPVLLGLLVPLAAIPLRGLRWLAVAGAAAVAWPVAAQLAFDGGRILPFVAGSVALLAGAAGTLVVTYATELRERRRLRAEFARFAPPSVVDALLDGSIGATRQEATVLFADLRGFTAHAEAIGAERVIELLNRHLGGMSDAILDHGGTVVSYMGDGIMAVFGAPVAQPDHADRAVAAARAMLALDTPLPMGIGIATGPVMSGTVGSSRRIEYATVGDTTNTAARLEALTKETGHALHVAASTHAALREDHGLVDAGEHTLRGHTRPTRVFTPG